MRRTLRIALFAAVCGAAIVVGPVGVAWAASPPNDTFAGATVIPSVPFSTTEDTTQAHFYPASAAAYLACGDSFDVNSDNVSNGVWFKYTATSNQALQVDPSASSYVPAIAVVTGKPSSFSCQSENEVSNCLEGGQLVIGTDCWNFTALKGTTYYINVAAGGVSIGEPRGGTLRLSLTQLWPMILPTLNAAGTFSKNGSATLTGTAGCAPGTTIDDIGGELTQSVGRVATVVGSWNASAVVCDGAAHPWSAVITPFSGLFRGGKATATGGMTQCLFSTTAIAPPCVSVPNPPAELRQTIQLNKN